jgi:dTDP-4-amino-4,6-dideoxygalactose transaminase
MHGSVTRYGDGRANTNAYIAEKGTQDGKPQDIGSDIFARGLCLPSDNKMTVQEQDRIIEMIRACFA